jgi:hypothetical protein
MMICLAIGMLVVDRKLSLVEVEDDFRIKCVGFRFMMKR